MNRQAEVKQSGKSSKMSDLSYDTLNPASFSGETELDVPIQSPGTEANSIKQLLNEFKGLYAERLRCLELDNSATQEELMQKKVNFLQSYVNDLADQNQVLVQTVEDLQKQADHKVSNWGMKLHSFDHSLEVSEVDLKTLWLDNLDGPVTHITHSHSSGSFVHILSELENLRIQLQKKDLVISDLEKELRENLQQKQKLSNLRVEATKLQEELKRKEEEWRQREDELKHDMDHQKAEERRRHEHEKREKEEEWVKKVEEEKKKEERWKRVMEEERKAHAEAVKKWAEKAALLNYEIQKQEMKMCALVRELTESKKQHSECQNELLRRETASEKLCMERDELRAKMEDRGRECVHLTQTKERLEADLALSHEKLQTLHLEVRSRDQFILQLRAEMKTAEQKHERTQEQVAALEVEARNLKRKVREHQEDASQLREKVRDGDHLKDQKEKEQQHLHNQVEAFEGELKKKEAEMELLHQQLKGAKEQLRDASFQAQEQKETAAIFKQKYTAAIEKVQRMQGQVGLLEEELQYSQQQLRESQLATHSVKEELAEMVQRYQEKVSQWENSQETLDQLTDELQANQNLLRESQQKVDQLKGLMGSLQEQKVMLECDLRLYQQSHSHSDEDYFSLLRQRQLLQKRGTEQNERLAECEKSILQMKSELERQTKEKVGLKQSLVSSYHAHFSERSQLEQEVLCLKKEVARLEIELADTQKVHVALLRQSEEELKEARQEAARRSSEVDVQRRELQRLQEELQKEKEEMRSVNRQKQCLSSHIRRLSQELEELRSKHQVTVEELAACAEEARRMEGCLNEGKLAEGKIRSTAVRLETEVAELRRNLQQAVDHKLEAEREKQDAQDLVDTLRLELEETRSNNINLRHESELVMTNVNQWITEQKASNENITAQLKAQNKVLLIFTEEKEHLQEANDTLKAEVKRLKEVADEMERDTERFKAQIRDQGIRRDERTMEKQCCVALHLSKIEDMQTRLRRNLEAIGMLNQQLNSLSGENKRLRRQLEEERSMRLLPPPPTSQQHSSTHPSFTLFARPPPPFSSLPSSLRPPRPLSLDTATGDTDGIFTQAKLCRTGLERPVESQALGEACRIRPSTLASLEDVQPGRASRGPTK